MPEEQNWKLKRIRVPNILSAIILLVLLAGSAYYVYETRPCGQTIYYTVGTIDPRFNISQAAFLSDAAEAAHLWNADAGRTLLAYSATGTMPVNLIFDSRQQQADVSASLTEQENALAAEKAQITTMQNAYDAEKQQFLADKAAGKSPATLNAEVSALNQQAANINSEADSLNAKIDTVNASASSFNTQAGTDFEEGEYVEQYGQSHIDLYEFENNTQLIRLMAHEFGHSLGLAHNTNPDSIMYPENIATTIVLSADDKAELQARCAVTWQNLNPLRQLDFSAQ